EGNFHKIRYYKDQTKHNIIRDVFVDENMNTYFTREFYYEKDILKTKKDILFKPDGSTKIFKTETDLFAYWFNLIFKDDNKIISNFHKIRYYKDQTKHNIIRDVFVDENMNTYFTREFYYEKDILKTKKDILFKPDGSTKIFKTETDLFAYWFNLIFKDGNKIIS